MKIRKAVITAASDKQRRLPLQTLVDRDGRTRSVLSLLIREVLDAGVEEVCVVLWPGDEEVYAEAVPEHQTLLRFVPQTKARGYADAIWRAREFTGKEPFLHLVGDHIYVGRNGSTSAASVVSLAESEACTVSAVRSTHERLLTSFGAVAGQRVTNRTGVYQVETVLEKPTPTVAEQQLIVPGLRAGHYLAFFGMHVLMPAVYDIIEEQLGREAQRPALLSDALAVLARRERYLAVQVDAERYDLGGTYGLLTAQLAIALSGRDRDEVLTSITTLLASGAAAR